MVGVKTNTAKQAPGSCTCSNIFSTGRRTHLFGRYRPSSVPLYIALRSHYRELSATYTSYCPPPEHGKCTNQSPVLPVPSNVVVETSEIRQDRVNHGQRTGGTLFPSYYVDLECSSVCQGRALYRVVDDAHGHCVTRIYRVSRLQMVADLLSRTLIQQLIVPFLGQHGCLKTSTLISRG